MSASARLQELLNGQLNGLSIDVDDAYGGQCWDLVVYATNTYHTGKDNTYNWQAGANVIANGNVAVGTAIATFLGPNGSYNTSGYANQHTAIFAGYRYGANGQITGFDVWDQNWGSQVVKKHTISIGGSSVSNAANYFVIAI